MTTGSSRKARASGITRSAKIVKGKMLKEARGNLCQLMFLLIKKRVFVVQSMEDLPEVQRMQWLVQRSKQGDCPRKVLVASLLLDCAVRRPMFTRMLGSLLEECSADDDASDVMQMALEMRSDDWGSGMFWTGQAKANLETGLKTVDSRRIGVGGSCVGDSKRQSAEQQVDPGCVIAASSWEVLEPHNGAHCQFSSGRQSSRRSSECR